MKIEISADKGKRACAGTKILLDGKTQGITSLIPLRQNLLEENVKNILGSEFETEDRFGNIRRFFVTKPPEIVKKKGKVFCYIGEVEEV